MCTAITLSSIQKEIFFGRTMDFSHNINPHIYRVPKGYLWNSASISQIRNLYSFIAIGQELDNLIVFFDGVNNAGLAAASLYFAGYAQYGVSKCNQNCQKVASFDFLHYILGKCASVSDVKKAVQNIKIIGSVDPVTHTVAPLHWIVTDKSGNCITIESCANGIEIFDNNIGVMANSPDFKWHMTNLRNYSEVSPTQTAESKWGEVTLKPFGQGAGSSSLPGGYTSPARFVRTAYLKTHIPMPENSEEAIISGFNIMKSVSIPKGAVISERDSYDYTQYTAFINTNTCEYYFNTYDNPQLISARLGSFSQIEKQPINLGSLNRPFSSENIGI